MKQYVIPISLFLVNGVLVGHWWMDLKGVNLDKQNPGPHAATSWKNMPVKATAEGNSSEVSRIPSIARSVSLSPCNTIASWKWKITRLHWSEACSATKWFQHLTFDTWHKEHTLRFTRSMFPSSSGTSSPPAGFYSQINTSASNLWCHSASFLQGCADK